MSNLELENMRVLILNSDFSPYDVVSWKAAIVKVLCSHTVVPVVNYPATVRDGRGNLYDVPAVCVLKKYVPHRRGKAPYSKLNIFARDRYVCQYCGITTDRTNRTVDHVIPKNKWNPRIHTVKLNSFENVVTCCKACNFKKKNRTPSQAGMKLLKQPRSVTMGEAYALKMQLDQIPQEWLPYLNLKGTNE